jgi:Fic family protein
MTWNWQQPDWPNFTYDSKALEPLEQKFLQQSGELVGATRHMGVDEQAALKIELISEEAIKTSEIEGEILNRVSVQSSLRQEFGLGVEAPGVQPAERGVSKMMAELYRSYADALTDQTMFDWHSLLLSGSGALRVIGGYRTHKNPMQVVSGRALVHTVHFEAPPSAQVPDEMQRFLAWFNAAAPGAATPLPALTRAGIAHLYFISIHPFEDGNGRIGRAIAEKALAQNLKQPSLIALAYTIERARNDYYGALERANKANEITPWLFYFARTVLEAQANTLGRVEFYIAKAKFHERLRGQLNERQDEVIDRLFREGIDALAQGFSAEAYINISQTSRATATRDLTDLVEKGALLRTGELRYTRYYLNLRP